MPIPLSQPYCIWVDQSTGNSCPNRPTRFFVGQVRRYGDILECHNTVCDSHVDEHQDNVRQSLDKKGIKYELLSEVEISEKEFMDLVPQRQDHDIDLCDFSSFDNDNTKKGRDRLCFERSTTWFLVGSRRQRVAPRCPSHPFSIDADYLSKGTTARIANYRIPFVEITRDEAVVKWVLDE